MSQHVARVEAELAAKVADLAGRIRRVQDSLDSSLRSETERIRSATETTRQEAAARRAGALATVADEAARRHEQARRGLDELAARAAPGPFGADLGTGRDDWASMAGSDGGPGLVRRGQIGGPAAGDATGAPALFPLFHDRGWYLDGDTDDTLDEIRSLLLRAVAGLPLKHLRIDVFDPRIEGRLGGFAPLRAAHPPAFPIPSTSASALRSVLEDVGATAAANAELVATEGVRSLGDLWRSRGTPTGDYRFVVVLNYPEGIDGDTQALLVRLARSGGPNGVNVVVQHDERATAADDSVRLADLSSHLRRSRMEADGTMLLSDYPLELQVSSDGSPSADLLNRVIDTATRRAASDTGPVVHLESLIGNDAQDPWSGDSSEGMEVPIARDGQRAVPFVLRSQNPPVSNVLVGGAVGQGKSNLLLTIIYALASRYGPDDLALYLLDFKRGLEFQRFAADESGRNWLPHAKVLSLESDREFGVAVLRHVADELARRATIFKRAGARDIEDYRRITGDKMARVLLIVDEFQVLFDGDDPVVDEAVELLETLSRQGRASGVHLLLASQTTTGVAGLRVKGESIFAQFPVRISLKNTANESEAILSQGNRAAASLAYRGEIVLNRNFGHDAEGSNERAVSAYAEPGYVHQLQAHLWSMRPGGTGPLVFVSTDFARAPTGLPRCDPAGPAIGLLGRPVAVSTEPYSIVVDQDVDQAVAVVGADDTLALPVLASLTRSLAASLDVRRVVVIDLTAPSDELAGNALSAALEAVAVDGVVVERFSRESGTTGLGTTVRSALASGDAQTLVLGLGWQRWTGLDDVHPVDSDDDDDFRTFSLREVLEDLAQRGALHGVHLVAWWSTLRSLQDHLGYAHQGIRHFVTAKLGLEDYRSLTSHSQPGVTGYPRVGHIDRAMDGGPTVIVPFSLQETIP